MATKTEMMADAASCWNRARPDEPVFVLLGRDRAAPRTIREWIAERQRRGKSQEAADAAQLAQAAVIAADMKAYSGQRDPLDDAAGRAVELAQACGNGGSTLAHACNLINGAPEWRAAWAGVPDQWTAAQAFAGLAVRERLRVDALWALVVQLAGDRGVILHATTTDDIRDTVAELAERLGLPFVRNPGWNAGGGVVVEPRPGGDA